MREVDNEILNTVFDKYKSLYWDIDYALKYSPRLFAFKEPDQRIRDAFKALSCKKTKDERFRDSRQAISSSEDDRGLVRELEYMLEKSESRYEKYTNRERDDKRDLLMMLMPVITSQKSSKTILMDVNQLIESIYNECKECSIREVCKEAFVIVNEYVASALRSVVFTVSSKK
ncbi:hypothetical protein MCHI_001074 [Candidatus Magnetoovum chiemensis]|nr:hypothetical protein MCHI_001074 [Candidatus Magnetoovum chiemensis]